MDRDRYITVGLPRITWRRLFSPAHRAHHDPAVEALCLAAFEQGSGEPLNAYDDAERIVQIVREAIAPTK